MKILKNKTYQGMVEKVEKLTEEEALSIVLAFLTTEASPEEKHTRRVNKIIAYEENN